MRQLICIGLFGVFITSSTFAQAQIFVPDASALLSAASTAANMPVTTAQTMANTAQTEASTQAQQIQNQIEQAKVPYAAQQAAADLRNVQLANELAALKLKKEREKVAK